MSTHTPFETAQYESVVLDGYTFGERLVIDAIRAGRTFYVDGLLTSHNVPAIEAAARVLLYSDYDNLAPGSVGHRAAYLEAREILELADARLEELHAEIDRAATWLNDRELRGQWTVAAASGDLVRAEICRYALAVQDARSVAAAA